MLKKTLAIVLVMVLAVCMAVPALAAGDGLDEKLERVTKIVKDTLDIEDDYTQFNGNLTEDGNASYWELTWSNDTVSLNVTADKNGKVLRYYRYADNNDINSYYYGYSPMLPKTTADDAYPSAEAFVDKVLGDTETASFDPYDAGRYANDVDSYMFTGGIELNGLRSPITFYVQVDTRDMRVSSYYRSDGYNQFMGSVPSATAAISADKAAALLAGTVELRLVYVLDEDGKTAVLQYLPVYSGDYIVDAKTGELINLNELYNELLYSKNDAGMGMETADAVATGGSAPLSEVEQTTVDALEGAFSKEELDAAVRGMKELGVDSAYTLQSVSYSVSKDTSEVLGQLMYTEKISDETVLKDRFPDAYSAMKAAGEIRPIYYYKSVTVDAMTGELVSLYSYASVGSNEKNTLATDTLQKNAGDFLKKYFPDTYASSGLNESDSDAEDGRFIYSQLVNDILFPANSAQITVNDYDGTIDSFSLSWTDDVSFDSADGLVSLEAAAATYIGCFDTLLQYVQVPEATDAYNYAYALKLAYQYDAEKNVAGVDAKTGKAIIDDSAADTEPLVYDDLQGAYGKNQIEALAYYGIGFPGTSFKPTAQLTQKDALVLFLSAVGYNSEDEDDLYQMAYNYNLLTDDERDPERAMTRAQLVTMLIGATEYAPAAQLPDIYVCGFDDDAKISDDYYGYVAIAKGLGVVRGDANNNFNPERIITRQDTAIILYNYMSR